MIKSELIKYSIKNLANLRDQLISRSNKKMHQIRAIEEHVDTINEVINTKALVEQRVNGKKLKECGWIEVGENERK